MIDCIFCKIIKGEIPGKFVYKDKDIVAIYDINPKSPVHVLVMPVKHIESLIDIKIKDEKLMGKIMMTISKIAKKLKIGDTGYKVVVNNGRSAGQLVYHLHFHLLGGWEKTSNWRV